MTKNSLPAESGNSMVRPDYEPPMVIAIGNLHSVVAGTTQNLVCDSIDGSPQGGDVNMPGC
jgi:hypothetical protein